MHTRVYILVYLGDMRRKNEGHNISKWTINNWILFIQQKTKEMK